MRSNLMIPPNNFHGVWHKSLAAIFLMALVFSAGCIFDQCSGEATQTDDEPVEVEETTATAPAEVVPDRKIAEESEMVVLVHGLGRTQMSMMALEWSLEREGYQVFNWGYSSTCCPVEELAQELADELKNLEDPRPTKIHFVGHSLGNIIIRWVLSNDEPREPGRVVMLAPPNHGAETADRYVDWFGWLLDPLDDLVTEEGSTARQLPILEEREVGVIAGQYDGKVSVDETRLEAHDDHAVVGAAHTFIMNRPDVHAKIIAFLEDAAF